MLDREAGYQARQQAAVQAEAKMPRDPRRIEALHKMLWEPRYLHAQRRYAIDQLLQYDPDFKQKLDRRIVLLRNGQTRQYVFDLAVERKWKDFTPALVRAYAQPVKGISDAGRPERAAIQKLNPDRPVEDVIFDVFANAEKGYDYRQQVAAWALLCRTSSRDALIALLDSAPDGTTLVSDLRVTASQLGVLPYGREGVLWMASWRDPEHASFWTSARDVVATLDREQRRGLDMRHLPVLVEADTAVLQRSAAELAGRIETQLARAQHYYKGPTYDAPLSAHPQRFSHWRDQLVWADLVTIETLLQLLRDRALVSSLFQQADADELDSTTEYGGVLELTSGPPKAVAFEPLARVNNWKYVPHQDMMQQLYTSLAHYHFHAQSHRNSDHAGPGQGDLRMADNVRAACVVFTFVTKDKLNVDYYHHGGVVVDLGTVVR